MASQQGIVGRPDASRATPAAMTVDDGLIAGLPGYSVVGVLGQGTDSTVYRVVRHGRDYALKLIRRPVGDRANDVMPFRREAALLARIDHPRLPRIHTVGQVAGHAYLVMDFIDGNKLSTLIGSQGMDETQVWSIAHDVAEALIAVHRVGLVHRDVKPDNIIIGPDGGAWLVDFGLARAGACEAGEGVAGTPLYASPEQVGLLRRPVDGRSDLYSLGVTLFELATGAPPFDATDVGQLLREHATQAPPDLRAVRPDRSASLEAVVRRLLAKDPDDRYQTAAGLLADVPGPAASGPEPPAGTSVDDDPAAAISETPFVGREQELASLHALWEETRHGRGKLVLVRGPVGIGKTRLVTQFTTSLSHAGVPVMNARRVASDAAPLSMLRAAVNDYLARLARRPQALRAPALERMALAAAQYSDLIAAVVPDLARLIGLSPPSSGASLGTEHAGEVIAATLIEHARLEGGMVIHLEGCQHLDPATLEALRAMAPCLADSNLMVILALRDGPGGEEALALLRQALDRHIDADLVIDRLRPADIDELLNQYLPGARIDAGQLASRSDGNPLTLIEYLRLIVELGLLQPSWGTWQLDADALDRLDLPQEAFELMERRLGSLTETSQSVLRTAAVLYDGFTCHLLAAVSGLPADTVTQALQDALDTRLLEDEGHGRYGFLHDYTVELLLADLQPETLRHLHQRAGCALEADPAEPDDPPTAFRRAHHYLSGEIGQSPHSMLRACATAGRSAMTADSPADALWFLQRGRDAAISISADVDSEFLALLGRAQRECGLFQDAEATLQNALTSTRDLVLRAEIFGHLARTYVGLLRLDDAIATIRLGLAELGLPTLSAGVAGTVAGVVRALGLMAPAWIGPLIRPVSAKRRARDEIAASLYDVVAQTHIIGLRYGAAALALAAELTLLRRLGRCADLVRVHAALGYCLRMVPGFRTVAWPFRHALRLGAHLRDPRPTAVCLLLDALSGLLSGTQGGQRLSSCLAAQGRWLDIVIFRDALRVLCRYEAYRGNIDAARRWYQEGLARFGQEGTTGLESAAIAIDAVAGQAADADRRLADASASPASQHWLPRLHLATARILAMTERGEIGEPFDQAVADLDSIVDA
ncbi:MAG: protein kinase, partial [Micromonosporaceae bacterium]|nr:protein kinase [Micromonosporaceae bacterium]